MCLFLISENYMEIDCLYSLRYFIRDPRLMSLTNDSHATHNTHMRL